MLCLWHIIRVAGYKICFYVALNCKTKKLNTLVCTAVISASSKRAVTACDVCVMIQARKVLQNKSDFMH